MIARLILAPDLRDRLVAEADAAFPRECCGLIEGVRVFPPPLAGEVLSPAQAGRSGGGRNVDKSHYEVRALDLHRARNLAARPDRFEIDPAAQFALLRRLRGTGREIVGCYHSHPNGRPELSVQDRAGAFENDFLWLVIAIAPASGDLGPRTSSSAGSAVILGRHTGTFARNHPVTAEDGRAPNGEHSSDTFQPRMHPPPPCGEAGEPVSLSAGSSSREPGGGNLCSMARHSGIANGFDVKLAAFTVDAEDIREVPVWTRAAP